jgi:hypothetical protein
MREPPDGRIMPLPSMFKKKNAVEKFKSPTFAGRPWSGNDAIGDAGAIESFGG